MYKLDILTNPAGNSEGLDRKMEIPNGRGVCDYGNPRAWGDNAFWKFRRQGGLKYAGRLWYGMDIIWNRPVQQERERLKHLHIFTMFDFSEHQILQVLEYVASIFTLSDIHKSVEYGTSVMPRKFYQLSVLCLRTYHVTKTGMIPILIATMSLTMSSWMNGMNDNKLFDMIVENIIIPV